jgi:hypothetical protein
MTAVATSSVWGFRGARVHRKREVGDPTPGLAALGLASRERLAPAPKTKTATANLSRLA